MLFTKKYIKSFITKKHCIVHKKQLYFTLKFLCVNEACFNKICQQSKKTFQKINKAKFHERN